jgi:hypothetical protein
MEQKTKIKCPNCGQEIDVNEILYHQLEEDFKKRYNLLLSEIKEKEENINEQIKNRVEEKLKLEKELIKKEIQVKLEEEEAEKFKTLQDELNEKSTKLKEFNKAKAEIEKLKREKDELRESIEADAQRKINEIISREKEKIQKNVQEKAELTIKEYKKQFEDQNKLIEEMKRKAEQGSMQMQGEIQELALEDLLRALFPFDIINEVPKGVKGADVIQTVVNGLQQVCGKIIYESKRTKAFSEGWIEKLKEDQRNQQSDLAVIITEVLPKDMERFGRKDGVWICTYQEAKGVTFVLREMILKTHSVRSSEENKSDKMELLYHYLTGVDFKQRVEAIVEGFSELKIDLDKEKRAMQKIWKTREKQIEKVITNTIDMYGAIKGIAGNAIQSVKALELPEPEEK